MFHVPIPIQQRIDRCFHTLHEGFVRWMKPRSTSLLLGTIADLAKGKSELLVENALLRQQLVILHRQVKRPACSKTDRFLLLFLARMMRTWKQALFIVQPETLRGVASGTLPLVLEAQVKGGCETAEALSRDDCVDQGDGQEQSTLGQTSPRPA